MALELLSFAALGLACVALASIVWSTLSHGISPMPTSPKVKRAVLSLLPGDVVGEVHELGAGWGTLAWPIAAALPGLRVTAWEISPVPYLFMRLRLLLQPRPNLTLRFADFEQADLSRAGLVVTYLWTGAMATLGPRFERELPAGARVLTHTFAWHGKEPEIARRVDDLYRTPILRYRIAPHSA